MSNILGHSIILLFLPFEIDSIINSYPTVKTVIFPIEMFLCIWCSHTYVYLTLHHNVFPIPFISATNPSPNGLLVLGLKSAVTLTKYPTWTICCIKFHIQITGLCSGSTYFPLWNYAFFQCINFNIKTVVYILPIIPCTMLLLDFLLTSITFSYSYTFPI